MKKIFFAFTGLAMLLCHAGSYAQRFRADVSKWAGKDAYALIETDYGKIKIRLYKETPGHRDNFIRVAQSGYFDSTLFHRIIYGFMIQGGEPNGKYVNQGKMKAGSEHTIPAEIVDTLYHRKGALAAARLPDNVNPQKASSGSQFYIVQGKVYNDQELDGEENRRGRKMSQRMRMTYKTDGGTAFLDGNYTIFGEVVEGIDAVDRIAATRTQPGDRPTFDVRMKVTVLKP